MEERLIKIWLMINRLDNIQIKFIKKASKRKNQLTLKMKKDLTMTQKVIQSRDIGIQSIDFDCIYVY